MSHNSQFTVATHILTLLSIHDKPLTSRYISGSVNTNPVVVRRIIGVLQTAGLVTTQMGAEGGTSIMKPPHDITLLDVYRATGQGSPFVTHTNPNPLCICGGNILSILSPVLDKAQQALENELAATTIADIAQRIQMRVSDLSNP